MYDSSPLAAHCALEQHSKNYNKIVKKEQEQPQLPASAPSPIPTKSYIKVAENPGINILLLTPLMNLGISCHLIAGVEEL